MPGVASPVPVAALQPPPVSSDRPAHLLHEFDTLAEPGAWEVRPSEIQGVFDSGQWRAVLNAECADADARVTFIFTTFIEETITNSDGSYETWVRVRGTAVVDGDEANPITVIDENDAMEFDAAWNQDENLLYFIDEISPEQTVSDARYAAARIARHAKRLATYFVDEDPQFLAEVARRRMLARFGIDVDNYQAQRFLGIHEDAVVLQGSAPQQIRCPSEEELRMALMVHPNG